MNFARNLNDFRTNLQNVEREIHRAAGSLTSDGSGLSDRTAVQQMNRVGENNDRLEV